MELNGAGTDYLASADVADDAEILGHWWPTLQGVLASGVLRETRSGIRNRWPAGQARPSPATLYRWLERAVTRGLVVRDGDGVRRQPCRYRLKGREE